MSSNHEPLIAIEAEDSANPLSLLRVRTAEGVSGEGLTAAQAHVLVGDLLAELFPIAREPA